MSMEQRQYTITFLTPAFLGDANQNAAWRTPPFKAELRHWWRVAMAARGYDAPRLRYCEGRLFGDAAGSGGCKSAVRLRLHGQRAWRYGSLTEWAPKGGSEKLTITSGKHKVPADLYLGYGPIEHKKGKGPSLGNECAIDVRESAEIELAWPDAMEGADALDEALGLMNALGSVGGRSRNGWGSYTLAPAPTIALTQYAEDWRRAIAESSWPRAIGRDDRGLLVWQSAPQTNWEPLIRELGNIRKSLCTEAGPLRPLMSFPVTGKKQRDWTDKDRVPNTLRFKIVTCDDKQLRAQIAHIPCRPSCDLWERLDATAKRRFPEVWGAAHELLDDELQRVTQ